MPNLTSNVVSRRGAALTARATSTSASATFRFSDSASVSVVDGEYEPPASASPFKTRHGVFLSVL